MTLAQCEILLILVSILFLFVWGRWRYDIVALFALFTSSLLGLIPSDQIFTGFGHPATITVAIVLVLSYGLTKTGAVEGISKAIKPLVKYPSLHVAALIFIAAFLSMFMNNVGALALLMPIAIQSTVGTSRSASAILMPLSFGSILGGLVTLIGTPPNIIIATYREKVIGQPYKMFDFSPVGGVVAAIGLVFIFIIGWRLVKIRRAVNGEGLFEIESYLFEVKIPVNSDLKKKTIKELEQIISESDFDVTIVSLIHKNEYSAVPPKRHRLVANDLLIIEGAQEEIDRFVSKYKLDLLSADSRREAISNSADTVMTEVVLGPSSNIVGRAVEKVRFKGYYNVNLLAVSRENQPKRSRLRDLVLKAGDVLLLHGEVDVMEDVINRLGCFPLAERGVDFGKRKFAIFSLLIFAFAIFLSATGILPIQVALGVAALFMVIFNVIPVRELYDSIDWPVIVLLGAMIPVGTALETTGTTDLIANSLLTLAGDVSIVVILALVLIITMTVSDILNNAATAILMAPIAKSIAETSGVSVDPFLMAVAIGASCAFLTPIGHQNNALVMGPGGYKFGDYWRVGLPLEIIIVVVSIPALLYFWPL